MTLTHRGVGPSLVLLRPGTIDGTALSELYDRCGEHLFRLAHIMTGDTDTASSAVVRAFEQACTRSTLAPAGSQSWHELARLTYAAASREADSGRALRTRAACACARRCCMRAWSPEQRALLALTMYGDHDYREAARLIGLDPRWAAALVWGTLSACQEAPHQSATMPPC